MKDEDIQLKREPSCCSALNDCDLQTLTPVTEDQSSLAEMSARNTFDKLACCSHPANQELTTESQQEEVNGMMTEAENEYDSMMEIREQLKQAYEELMQLKS